MEGLQRRAMTDRDDGGGRQFLLEQAVERRLRGFIERRGRLIEEQILRLVQQRAGESRGAAARRARASGSSALPRSSCEASWGNPTAISASLTWSEPIGAGFRRIDDRGLQRADRKIRPLRQHHQRGVGGNRDRAGPERPDAGDGAEQGRFAGAGRAGDQGALVAAKAEAVGRDQRVPFGSRTRSSRRSISSLPLDGTIRSHQRRVASAAGAGDRHFEPVEPRHHRAPFRQRPIGRDEK